MERKLLLLLTLLSVSIGTWAQDGSDSDGYWLSFDSWYEGNSFAEIVTKINVSKPGGLAKAVAAINGDTYSSTKEVSDGSGNISATYKTAKVLYVRCSNGYFNSDDLAALSDLDFETIDLQDAFYKESADGEKKAFTFSNSSVKNLILPDGWTKEEVNACAKVVGSQLGSAYSQSVNGMTETKDVTRYYFDNEGSKGDEYTGSAQYQEGDNWFVKTYTDVVKDLTAVEGNPVCVYKNNYNGDKEYTVDASSVEEKTYSWGGTYNAVTLSTFDVALSGPTTKYYKTEADGGAEMNTWDMENVDGTYYYNVTWDNSVSWHGSMTSGTLAVVKSIYTYNDPFTNQNVNIDADDSRISEDKTYATIDFGENSKEFEVKMKYYYTYEDLNGEQQTVSYDEERTTITLKEETIKSLIAETNPETSVLGASLVAYVNKSNTLFDAMQHCFIDNKTNSKLGEITRWGDQQYKKLKALTISGNAVARDWANVKSLAFTDGHLVFDVPADELNTAAYGAANGKTRTLKGTEDKGAMYGATVLYLDLSSVVIDDAYCDDLVLSKLNIMENSNVEVWIPAEGSGLKTIPADFGTNAIKEMCIPSNIETIRTRAFPSCDHIWTTAATDDVKETWENEYTKYDNGAVAEYNSEGKVLATHDRNAAKTEEHYGFNTNRAAYTYGTYTFGSNLKLIESNAFSNTQPNVKDVYVLNTTAPECHVDAFNTVMYYGNNGYDAGLISAEGVVTRDAYCNGGRWITMLHYPKQTKAPNLQRYTDPTRQYSIATADKDGNGATIYYPNHSEFGFAYAQGTTGYVWNAWNTEREGWANAMKVNGHVTTGWNSADQAKANTNYANAEELGQSNWSLSSFYDVTANGTLSPSPAPTEWTSVYWSEKKYKLADSQVDNTYEQLYDADYRGWHQFVLNGYSANTTQEVVFERSYIKDSDWWTICLPYDLTYKEMIKFFGTEQNLPILSRLLYVVRDVKNERITLKFSKNLMLYKDNMSLTADGIEDVSTTEGSVNEDDVVLHAGVPYVIKPYIPTSGDSELASRRFAIYKETEAGLYEKLQKANEMDGEELISLVEDGLYTVPALVTNNTEDNTAEDVVEGKTVKINGEDYQVSAKFTYTMVGSLFNNLLPSYCYYLGWKWDNAAKTKGHACFWYNTKTGEDNQKWAWTNNTCIICPNWPENLGVHRATSTSDPARWIVGDDNSNTVDDDSYTTTGASARSNDILANAEMPEVSGEVNGINEVKNNETVTGENKVYDLNGRYLGNGTSGLTKGVYIVNGKKIIK